MRTRNAKWFEVRVKVAEMQDDGTSKPATKQYVVDAMSFTEAEANVEEYLKGFYSEHEVVTEKIARFKEVFLNDDETVVGSYFKVTFELITLDEKTNKEKRTRDQILIEAGSTAQAESLTHSVVMKDVMVEYRIVDISETKFMDVIEHEKK